jgi:site-specific recombinase XerD
MANLVRLVDRFLDHLALERNFSVHTLRAYRRDCRMFLAFLSRDYLGQDAVLVRPQDVDPPAVRAFLAAQANRGLSPQTQARRLSALRSLFRFACREGILVHNPAGGVRTPKQERKLPRHLRPGEIETLLEAVDGDEPLARRDRAILELLYATGMRVSELAELPLSALELDEGFATVFGKGSKERIVPIGAPALRALERYLRDVRPGLDRCMGRCRHSWGFLPRSDGRRMERHRYHHSTALFRILYNRFR